MMKKEFLKHISSKKVLFAIAIFSAGALFGGLVVNASLSSRIDEGNMLVNSILKDDGKLFDIDTKMLQAYQRPYDVLGTCSTTNVSTCDFSKLGQTFNQSFKDLNILAGQRLGAMKKIESYQSQFQAWSH